MDMYVRKQNIVFRAHIRRLLADFRRSGETDIEVREKSADDPNAIPRNR
ncbi:MAG: hypothetical protein ACQ9ET_04545 [Nitrosomonadaceae bacterium]